MSADPNEEIIKDAKYLWIEFNIKDAETMQIISDPILMRGDEEDENFLKQADETFPQPAMIYTECEGYCQDSDKDVYFDVMILRKF